MVFDRRALHLRMSLTKAWIGIGTNMGDRMEHLRSAVRSMQAKNIAVIRTSSIYETAPVGFSSEDLFLNAVIEVEWAGKPEELLQLLLAIETEAGRTRNTTERYTSRPLDLDILLFGKEVINSSELTLPHPRLHERGFVLSPLNELIPSYIHPASGKTIADLQLQCIDRNGVFVHDKPLSVNR